MKAPITLARAIPTTGWRVEGTVAFATKREWEPALLKLAVAKGEVTSASVAAELLGGRANVASRLIGICETLGLLKKAEGAWVATAAGQVAAQNNMVFMPERGAWSIFAAEDPLLPGPIVALMPWNEPPAAKEKDKTVIRAFERLPEWLVAANGRATEPLAGTRGAIRVDDLGGETRGERIEGSASSSAVLTVAPEGTRLQITGTVAGRRVDANVIHRTLDHEALWTSLLQQAGLLDLWDRERRALRVAFGDTTDIERSTMCRAVRIKAPEVSGLGRFDDLVVDSVALRPRSVEDAGAWAEWRLLRAANSYLVGDALQAAYRAASSPFEDVAPPCPSRADLARRSRGADRPPPVYWHLQAPGDWRLGEGNKR